MKANEFQIGDWVQWNFDVEPKHRQIFSIITEEDSDGNKEYYADLGDGEIYKDLIPISLTPEILEKNRFVWKAGGVVYEGGEDLTLVQCCDEWKLKPNLMSDDTFCYIEYVHELQHALRLCGIRDLADNFKL